MAKKWVLKARKAGLLEPARGERRGGIAPRALQGSEEKE